MNAEKFTQKSIEAIRDAQSCAIRNQNMQIDQQHLLYALLSQEGGLVAQLMKKMHIDSGRMAQACDREIQRIPKVSGPGREADRVYVSQSVDAALQENAELEYDVAHAGDPETIESIARTKLGLVKPGEKIFYDVGN